MSRSAVRILHISDIHRSQNAPTNNLTLLGNLRNDIRRTYGDDNEKLGKDAPHLGPPDVIVVSGDITQRAEPDEYVVARQFLDSLLDLVDGDRSRVVLVPGNHDVNWRLSKEAYVPVSKKEFEEQPNYHEPYRQTVKQQNGTKKYWRKQEEKYANRLQPFRDFFDGFYRGSAVPHTYSSDRDRMYTVYDYSSSLGMVIVGFNTCDEIDHLDRRAFVNTDAIYRAEDDPAFHWNDEGLLRIAVFHHNIRAVQHQKDFLDPKYLQILKRVGFQLCLHGHVHTAGMDDIFDPNRDRTLPLLGAGSLAAPYEDRPPAAPKGYNLLVVDRDGGAVFAHTRRHDENRLVWAADYCWEGKPYVTIFPPGVLDLQPRNGASKKLTITAPDGSRLEVEAPAETLVEQLLRAFVQYWEPTSKVGSGPVRYMLQSSGPEAKPLDRSLSLREIAAGDSSDLVLRSVPLDRDSPVALTVEDNRGQRFVTAVQLGTKVGELAEAFFKDRPGSGDIVADLIRGRPGDAVPRRLSLDDSLFDQGVGDDAVFRLDRLADSAEVRS